MKFLNENAIIDNRFYNIIKSDFRFGVELEIYLYFNHSEKDRIYYNDSGYLYIEEEEFVNEKKRKNKIKNYLNEIVYYYMGIDNLIEKVIYDGSLRDGDNGYEIVTRPLNFYEFSSVYGKFLKLLKNEFRLGYDDSTAIHVSFSSDYVALATEDRIEKLNWFKVAILSDIQGILSKNNRLENSYAASIKGWLDDFLGNIRTYYFYSNHKSHLVEFIRRMLYKIAEDEATEREIRNFFRVLSKLFGLYLINDKYKVFNISKYYSQNGRVEIRAFNTKMVDNWALVVRDVLVICSAVLLASTNLYEKEYRQKALEIIKDEVLNYEFRKNYDMYNDFYSYGGDYNYDERDEYYDYDYDYDGNEIDYY